MMWKMVKLEQREMISSRGSNPVPLTPTFYKQKTAVIFLPNCSCPQELTRKVWDLARTQRAVAKLPRTSPSVGQKAPVLLQTKRNRKRAVASDL